MGMSLGLVWSAGLVGPPVSERGGQGVAVARRGEGAGAIPLPLERGCAPVWSVPRKRIARSRMLCMSGCCSCCQSVSLRATSFCRGDNMFKNVGACCSIVCVVRARSAVIRACPVSAASKKWDSSHLPLSLRLQVIHDNGGDPPVWLQTTRSLIYLSKVVPWLVSPCFWCCGCSFFVRVCLLDLLGLLFGGFSASRMAWRNCRSWL